MANEILTTGSGWMPRGIEKAAVLLLSLDPAQSRRMLEELEFEEIRELSQAMSALGRIDAAVVERLLIEFRERANMAGGVVGSFERPNACSARSWRTTRSK